MGVVITKTGEEYILGPARELATRVSWSKGERLIDLYGDGRDMVYSQDIASIYRDEEFENACQN